MKDSPIATSLVTDRSQYYVKIPPHPCSGQTGKSPEAAQVLKEATYSRCCQAHYSAENDVRHLPLIAESTHCHHCCYQTFQKIKCGVSQISLLNYHILFFISHFRDVWLDISIRIKFFRQPPLPLSSELSWGW